VTVAIFAPSQSRQLLAGSGDPVYELNRGLQGSQLSLTASTTSVASQSSNAQLPPSMIYPDGNIIVSADYTGQIKVFRQDSAWAQRKADNSDTASIRLRGKSKGSASSIRPSGILTLRTNTSRAGSTRSSSRRNSIDSPTLPTNSSQTALSRNLEIPKSTAIARVNGRAASQSPIRHREPMVVRGRSQSNTERSQLALPLSDTVTLKKSTPQERLMLQEDGQSMAFYHPRSPHDSTYDQSRSVSQSPERSRRGSGSSDHSDDELDAAEARSFVDAEERLSSDDMVCGNCGARTFNAFKVQSGPLKGETKLRCSVYLTYLKPT
jgi:WD repeat-containing protein 44